MGVRSGRGGSGLRKRSCSSGITGREMKWTGFVDLQQGSWECSGGFFSEKPDTRSFANSEMGQRIVWSSKENGSFEIIMKSQSKC